MASAYGTQRENLMHSNGTTPYETVAVIVPTLFYTTITTILISLLNAKTKVTLTFQFCIEFCTLVIPIVLNVTVLADYAVEILTTACVLCLSLLLLLLGLSQNSKNQQVLQIQDYITNSRSTINIISVIAILAVDFHIFPRRFAKTETFGYSLMDVGVGLFIFSNGIVDGGQTNILKSLKGSLILFILGIGRLFVTKQIDYQVPVSEYGVHWNFFLTLTVTKVFVSLIFNVVNVKFIWINATLLMISHEILLETGLKNFVFRNIKRDTFITANREGVVSSVGYVYLYLFSAYFSYFTDLKKPGNKSLIQLSLLSCLTLFLSIIFQQFFGISRKLANAAYCFWVLFIGIFMTSLYYVFGKIVENIFKNKLHISFHLPLIFKAINYNGLVFFLLSNVLTGLVNILCDTLKVDSTKSLCIILLYMFVNCTVVCILYKKQIKLKL